jgi:hypothetical protein
MALCRELVEAADKSAIEPKTPRLNHRLLSPATKLSMAFSQE